MQLTTETQNDPPSTHPESLQNKVILVTGAAQRVGATIVTQLHAAGAKIVLHYRSSKSAAEKLQAELNQIRPNSVALVNGDLSQLATISHVVDTAHKQWSRLDGLINNASSFYPTPVASASVEQWDELMMSNLKAPFFLAQAAAQYLSVNQGCIVNIIDIHAERPLKGYPIYSIAKAGLAMLTKSLACELGPHIRVNGVAPGAILWPENNMDESTKQRIIEKTFLKRKGQPEDIARAVLFLVRDANYSTGQILAVDGGRSLNT